MPQSTGRVLKTMWVSTKSKLLIFSLKYAIALSTVICINGAKAMVGKTPGATTNLTVPVYCLPPPTTVKKAVSLKNGLDEQ